MKQQDIFFIICGLVLLGYGIFVLAQNQSTPRGIVAILAGAVLIGSELVKWRRKK